MCEQDRLHLGPGHHRKSCLVHGSGMRLKGKLERLAPHDLRRTCARLCHESGGELEQIQFLLGHVSVQTTERYLGCKQRLREAVNDKIGLETLGVAARFFFSKKTQYITLLLGFGALFWWGAPLLKVSARARMGGTNGLMTNQATA